VQGLWLFFFLNKEKKMFALQCNCGVFKITHNQYFLSDGTHRCAIYQHFFDKKTLIKNKHYGVWVASDGITFIPELLKIGSNVEIGYTRARTHAHTHTCSYCLLLFSRKKALFITTYDRVTTTVVLTLFK
jgi:hypothetical protein